MCFERLVGALVGSLGVVLGTFPYLLGLRGVVGPCRP